MDQIELKEQKKVKGISVNKSINGSIPHIIKYMGSKKPIIDFIVEAIEDIHDQTKPICDLFAGSCSVSAALRKKYDFISNDVQDYSRVLAQTYFSDLSSYEFNTVFTKITEIANKHFDHFKTKYGNLFFDYSKIKTLEHYQDVEFSQRRLLLEGEFETDFFLFLKYYSGTYWSFEQCVWIDSLRKSAEQFKNEKIYYALISSIMYAMSYSTQSTGHFAQYRDGNSIEAMRNIIIYREKSILELFSKKLKELIEELDNSLMEITTTTLSYENSMKNLPEGLTIYADPPYAPVHYSRFYHALETLVKYDYPSLSFKGRYREDRHQSPFSQHSKALEAFKILFRGVIAKKAQLVLSYSGSGVVPIDRISDLAIKMFSANKYGIEIKTLDHKHSTMGRFEDHERDVTEYLIIAKFI